jgi:predicted oxidoreductase
MSTSSVTALRKAIHVKLAGASALVAALGGTKVFDEAPRNVDAPYVTFSDTQVRDWSSSLSRGAEHLFVIAVWSAERGTKEAIEIGNSVIALLDDAMLDLDGYKLVNLRFVQFETKREANGRFARVNLRFRATTEDLATG